MTTTKKSKQFKKPEVVERRAALDQMKKEEMLAILIRNAQAHEAVHDLLSVKHVQKMSDGHALVWRVVKAFWDKYSELPSRDMLQNELHNRLNADPDALDPDELSEVDEFLEYAFDQRQHNKKKIAKSSVHADVAIATCKQFLEELLVMTARDEMFKDNTVPVALDELFVKHEAEFSKIRTLDAKAIPALFRDGWDKVHKLVMTKTNVAMIDTFLGGGGMAGEVIAIMAPYGSCKTTLAVQVAANWCKLARQLEKQGANKDGKRPVAVFGSTEMVAGECQRRLLSYLAKIPTKRLRTILSSDEGIESACKNKKPASTKETAYEKRVFRKAMEAGDGFKNEYKRILSAVALVNTYFIFIDLTGGEDSVVSGFGGVADMQSALAAEIRRRKDTIYPIGIVLDHASAMANRMIEGGYEVDQLRHILRVIPDQVGKKLAKPYKCPALVFHQLSGDANNRGPAADIHHTDAAECKAFGEFADFCIVGGKPTQDNRQLQRFNCTKHRREPPRGHAIVKIDGTYSQVKDRSDMYVVDPGTRQIVTKAEAQMAGGMKYKKSASPHDIDEVKA